MTMPNSLIIEVLFMLIAITALLLLSIYLYVRLHRSAALTALQGAAIFMIIAFIFRFMNKTSLDKTGHIDFGLLSIIAFVISLSSALVFVVLLIRVRNRGRSGLSMPPDLSVLFTELEDTILIYNRSNDLIGVNKPDQLEDIFPDSDHGLNQLVSLVDNSMKQNQQDVSQLLCDRNALEAYFQHGIESVRDTGNITDRKGRQYLLRVSPISDQIRSDLGMLVILHDITQEKQLLTEIEKSNQRLEKTCEELEKRIGLEQQLEAEKQRMFLLQQIQNDMADRLNHVMGRLTEMAAKQVVSEGRLLSELAEDLRQIYKQVRQTVHGMHKRQG